MRGPSPGGSAGTVFSSGRDRSTSFMPSPSSEPSRAASVGVSSTSCTIRGSKTSSCLKISRPSEQGQPLVPRMAEGCRPPRIALPPSPWRSCGVNKLGRNSRQSLEPTRLIAIVLSRIGLRCRLRVTYGIRPNVPSPMYPSPRSFRIRRLCMVFCATL